MSEVLATPDTAAFASPDGILHVLVLDGLGGARELPWEQLRDWSLDQGALWVHLDFEAPAAQEWLSEHSGLNDIAVEALTTPETRPRTLSRGENLLLTLRGINHNPGDEPEDMVSLRIWTDGQRLISTRRRSLRSTELILQDLASGEGPASAADLIVAYAQQISLQMQPTLERFEEEVLSLEDRVLGDRDDQVRQGLVGLRRRIIAIRRYIAPQREALSRLSAETVSWLDELNRLRLREASDRLIRHIEDLDEMRDRAILAQEELASLVAEQMNARTYLFTVAAVVFLPLGFITGLLGINVGGMPGVDSALAFWIVVALCAVIGVCLALLLRLRRWL
ncbi:MAG: zinc transporter ZntB [Halieaceae bacterium]|jgi:zinc transporter|nr:zinc transporter ZntB [Halieaceae bacterium]